VHFFHDNIRLSNLLKNTNKMAPLGAISLMQIHEAVEIRTYC